MNLPEDRADRRLELRRANVGLFPGPPAEPDPLTGSRSSGRVAGEAPPWT